MSDEQLLNTLENSAQVLLAPPNLVSEEQRHTAEQFFIAFEKSAISLDTCRLILEKSRNDFVLFQVASLFRRAIVRDWSMLGTDLIDAAHTYLLNYVVSRVSLAPCVREQVVLTLAIIYKRLQVEPVAEKISTLFNDIARLIQTGNTYMQLLACSILLALLNEFSSSSRTTSIGLTWELHSKCKVKFEQSDLKQVFIFCLQTLSGLPSSIEGTRNYQTMAVVERLLAVLDQIFTWGFTSRASKQMMSLSNGHASSFRPPLAWKDLILTQDIVKVLFQVHLKIRSVSSLVPQSLQCLSQLASVNGSIFLNEVAHRDFVENFIRALIEFVSGVELRGYECLGVASIIKSLLDFTPACFLMEIPEDLLSTFMACMTRLTCGFCQLAHLDAGRNQVEDDTIYMEAFEKSLDAWMTFVNHSSELPVGVLQQHATEIFSAYVQCHLSTQEGSTSNLEDEIEDEDEEDCEKFSDQLFAVGAFARIVPGFSISLLNRLFQEKISLLREQLHKIQPNVGCSSFDQQILDSLNEDLHWLLLISTNVLMSRGDGELPLIPEILIDYTLSDRPSISITSIVSEEGASLTPQGNSSQTIELIAAVFRLCQLETKAFQAGLVAYMSPQVTQSVMEFLLGWSSAYLLFDESYYSKMSPIFSASFGADSETSVSLINLLLDKILTNLSALNSEPGVVTKTLEVLKILVDRKNRCDVTVKCGAFWNMAANFSTNVFPFNVLSPDARKVFCQTLILASSASVTSEQRQTYVHMVLGSFSTRFQELLHHPDVRTIFHDDYVRVEVQSALDCLCAVTNAARASNASLVFQFLHPLLVDSVSVLDLYHNYEEVVQLVLELFSVVTKQLSCYLSNRESVQMYEVCLLMMQTFSKHNQGRRTVNKDAEEDQFSDLLSLIQIITNILSKDFISFADSETIETVTNGVKVDAAEVAFYGLNILIPLMTTELLKIPSLCSAYLGLLSYMAEIHAAQISQLPDPVFTSLSSNVEFALANHGTEIMRSCLEFISFLATYAYEQKPIPEESSLHRFGLRFLKALFELLLLETFDVELMEVASSALFALFCCHQQRYCELVNELVNRHASSPYHQRLLDAFNKLTPPGFQMQATRQNQIKFLVSFQQFLVNVRGFMCVR